MPNEMFHEMWLGLQRFWALNWIVKGSIMAGVVAAIVLIAIAAATGGSKESTKGQDSSIPVTGSSVLDDFAGIIAPSDTFRLDGYSIDAGPFAAAVDLTVTGPYAQATCDALRVGSSAEKAAFLAAFVSGLDNTRSAPGQRVYVEDGVSDADLAVSMFMDGCLKHSH